MKYLPLLLLTLLLVSCAPSDCSGVACQIRAQFETQAMSEYEMSDWVVINSQGVKRSQNKEVECLIPFDDGVISCFKK